MEMPTAARPLLADGGCAGHIHDGSNINKMAMKTAANA
jgi:hypothetical protein